MSYAVTVTIKKPAAVTAGNLITYKVTVRNTGPVVVTGLNVTNINPYLAGETVTLIGAPVEIPVGGRILVEITGTVLAAYTGVLENTVMFTGNNQAATATVQSTVNGASVLGASTITATSANSNGPVTWTVIAKNSGTVAVTNVSLSGNNPNLTGITVSPQTVSSISAGGQATFTVNATVKAFTGMLANVLVLTSDQGTRGLEAGLVVTEPLTFTNTCVGPTAVFLQVEQDSPVNFTFNYYVNGGEVTEQAYNGATLTEIVVPIGGTLTLNDVQPTSPATKTRMRLFRP
jgi:hypothetical protein